MFMHATKHNYIVYRGWDWGLTIDTGSRLSKPPQQHYLPRWGHNNNSLDYQKICHICTYLEHKDISIEPISLIVQVVCSMRCSKMTIG